LNDQILKFLRTLDVIFLPSHVLGDLVVRINFAMMVIHDAEEKIKTMERSKTTEREREK